VAPDLSEKIEMWDEETANEATNEKTGERKKVRKGDEKGGVVGALGGKEARFNRGSLRRKSGRSSWSLNDRGYPHYTEGLREWGISGRAGSWGERGIL